MLGLAAAADDDGKAAAGGDTITQEAGRQAARLIEANGKDRKAFLKWAKVERIEDIAAAAMTPAWPPSTSRRPRNDADHRLRARFPGMVCRPRRHPDCQRVSHVMAVGPKGGKSVTRVAYLNKLAGEILTGEPMANPTSAPTWSAAS
jgi:hypothetical protein